MRLQEQCCRNIRRQQAMAQNPVLTYKDAVNHTSVNYKPLGPFNAIFTVEYSIFPKLEYQIKMIRLEIPACFVELCYHLHNLQRNMVKHVFRHG
jgi:hypothetical protein